MPESKEPAISRTYARIERASYFKNLCQNRKSQLFQEFMPESKEPAISRTYARIERASYFKNLCQNRKSQLFQELMPESKEPAISRTYARINNKNKVSGLKIILTVFSFSKNF
jgi:hypothetical protein